MNRILVVILTNARLLPSFFSVFSGSVQCPSAALESQASTPSSLLVSFARSLAVVHSFFTLNLTPLSRNQGIHDQGGFHNMVSLRFFFRRIYNTQTSATAVAVAGAIAILAAATTTTTTTTTTTNNNNDNNNQQQQQQLRAAAAAATPADPSCNYCGCHEPAHTQTFRAAHDQDCSV